MTLVNFKGYVGRALHVRDWSLEVEAAAEADHCPRDSSPVAVSCHRHPNRPAAFSLHTWVGYPCLFSLSSDERSPLTCNATEALLLCEMLTWNRKDMGPLQTRMKFVSMCRNQWSRSQWPLQVISSALLPQQQFGGRWPFARKSSALRKARDHIVKLNRSRTLEVGKCHAA